MATKAFKAGLNGAYSYGSNPREAATKFFEEHPSRRKCGVIEGELEGDFFVVKYGKPWPRRWVNVTKAVLGDVPTE